MYCFHSVSGVSAFGKYEGTGGAWTSGNNGGAQDVGFKPRFLITKNIDTGSTHFTEGVQKTNLDGSEF